MSANVSRKGPNFLEMMKIIDLEENNNTNSIPKEVEIKMSTYKKINVPNPMLKSLESQSLKSQSEINLIDFVHNGFLTQNINLDNYPKLLNNAINIEIQRPQFFSNHYKGMQFNENFEELVNNLINKNKKIFHFNILKTDAKFTILNKEKLGKALELLEFEQIEEIIKTFKNSTFTILEDMIFDSKKEKEKKKEEVRNFIAHIHSYLNNILDSMEAYNNREYYDEEYYD